MAGVIEQPVLGRGIPQLFHFRAGLERKPAIPSRWRAPGSIAGGLRGVWVRAIWRGGRLRVADGESTTFKLLPRRPVVSRGCRSLQAYCGVHTHLATGDIGTVTPVVEHPQRSAKCNAHLARRDSHSAALAAQHSPPRGASTLGFRVPPSMHVPRGCRSLRAQGEVRAHLALGKLVAATPTAFHPRPRWSARFHFRIPRSAFYAVRGCRPLRANGEVRAHLGPGKLAPQRQSHSIAAPWAARANLRLPPSAVLGCWWYGDFATATWTLPSLRYPEPLHHLRSTIASMATQGILALG
jgi:hypothetical protein